MSASAARSLANRPPSPAARAARPAPSNARPRRAAPPQPGLFEAEPYRVARPRPTAHSAAPRRAPAPRETTEAPSRNPAISVHAAPEHSRSLVPFVGMCVSIVLGALIAVLLLNTTMAKGAYETRDLRNELAYLQDQRSELLASLEEHASPQSLSQAAHDLGMVPAHRVGFVTISSGAVVAPGATS